MKRIRIELFDISQAEMARIANVAQATVSRWETGELSPGLIEMGLIRDEAASRAIPWDDSRFFTQGPQNADKERAS